MFINWFMMAAATLQLAAFAQGMYSGTYKAALVMLFVGIANVVMATIEA